MFSPWNLYYINAHIRIILNSFFFLFYEYVLLFPSFFSCFVFCLNITYNMKNVNLQLPAQKRHISLRVFNIMRTNIVFFSFYFTYSLCIFQLISRLKWNLFQSCFDFFSCLLTCMCVKDAL